MPSAKPLFLSYASQDADAARRIANGLRDAGLEVWFDQSELRGGDAWDARIRRQVRECALFLPVISANTDARSEGYFRLEWKLAVDRSHLIAADQAFLLPIAIDGTREAAARVPEEFNARQWTRLTGGRVTTEFVQHVLKLLEGSSSPGIGSSPPVASTPVAHGLRRPGRRLLLGTLVLVLGVPAAWLAIRAPSQSTAGPPLMSVAFMPFAGGDADGTARRISAEATAAFERAFRSAAVISHGLASTLEDRASDPRKVGHELNVRYIVEGDLRQEGTTRVLDTRLIETERGMQTWSTRLDASGEHPEWRQKLVAELVNALRPVLYQAERKRVAEIPPSRQNGVQTALQADELLDRDPSPKGQASARRLYEQVLAESPRSQLALQGLFYMNLGEFYRPKSDRERLIKDMDRLSLLAVEADRRDIRAWRARAVAMSLQWRWDEAFGANAEALRIDPFHNSALAERAFLFILSGRAEEALPLLERAMALDPQSPAMPNFLHFKCWANLHLGRFDEAVEACEKGAALGGAWMLHVRAAAAYARKGDLARGRAALAEARKRAPALSIAYLSSWKASDNPVFIRQREENVFNALRALGLPET